MSRTKKFEKFEDAVARFFEKIKYVGNAEGYVVQQNVKLNGPDGPRQIDILLEGKIGTFSVRTMIECKDYRGKVTVEKVDEIASKMADVKAHKAVLVTPNGFSRTAIQKANRLGIELCTFAEALSSDWQPKIDLPILLEELSPTLDVNFNLHLPKGATIDKHLFINDKDVVACFSDYWNSCDQPLLLTSEEIFKDILKISPPFYLRNSLTAEILTVEKLEFRMRLNKIFYYGNLSRLPNTLILNKIINNDRHIILDAEHLLKYREFFARYNTAEEIPSKLAIEFRCLSKPLIKVSNTQFNLKAKKM